MKMSFVTNCGFYAKTGKWDLSLKRDNMIQIQDMFKNGKPDVVLKTVKVLNIKNNSLSNFNFSKKF